MRTAGRMVPCTVTRPTPSISANFGCKHGVRGVRHHIHRPRVRGERHGQYGGIRRIDLGIGRRIRQSCRQGSGRRVDRRLHVLRRRIHRPSRLELQRDLTGALSTLRGHRHQTRDFAELPLSEAVINVSTNLRTCAGQLGHHLDGRKIHLRQRRYRQPVIAKAS